jgi:Acetyltransferase (GNAT) domain
LCHTIPLPASWAEYDRRVSAKKRYNLKRQERLLRQHGNGSLELRCIRSRDEVRALVEDIQAIGGQSGPARPRRLIRSFATPTVDESTLCSLADHGLLLCYVLRCGGRPCAAALGSIHGQRYCLESIPRDRRFDRFSPGATLLHLLIGNLIRQWSVRLIDLGFGEPSYKHASTNVTEPRGSVFLLRRAFSNRVRRWVHASFKGLVAQLKGVVRST